MKQNQVEAQCQKQKQIQTSLADKKKAPFLHCKEKVL